jgi:hypothetical protein
MVLERDVRYSEVRLAIELPTSRQALASHRKGAPTMTVGTVDDRGAVTEMYPTWMLAHPASSDLRAIFHNDL